MGEDDCGDISVCSNIDGGFTCSCPAGYLNTTTDGRTCVGKSQLKAYRTVLCLEVFTGSLGK